MTASRHSAAIKLQAIAELDARSAKPSQERGLIKELEDKYGVTNSALYTWRIQRKKLEQEAAQENTMGTAPASSATTPTAFPSTTTMTDAIRIALIADMLRTVLPEMREHFSTKTKLDKVYSHAMAAYNFADGRL